MPYNPQGVDPRLVDILETAAARYPLRVEFISGFRPGDSRQHGRGHAVDVQLYDGGGTPIPNYQATQSFRAYERFAQYARAVQQEKYPELNDTFRWGGYFSGAIRDPFFGAKGKYGAVDLMHFDVDSGMQMAGGSWEDGLTPEQRRMTPGAVSVGLGRIDPVVASLFGPGGPKPPADIPVPVPKGRPTDIAYANPAAGAPEPRLVNAVVAEQRRFANGSRGSQVLELQRFLNARGIRDSDGRPLAEDGLFGNRTEAAVRSYQRSSGLMADGVVGRKTALTMLRDDQVPLPRARPPDPVAPMPQPRPAYGAGAVLAQSLTSPPVVVEPGTAPVTPVERRPLEPDPVAEPATRPVPDGLTGGAAQPDMTGQTTDGPAQGPDFGQASAGATDPALSAELGSRRVDRSLENPNPPPPWDWFMGNQTNLGTANSPLASGIDEYTPQTEPAPGARTVDLFKNGNTVNDMMAGFNATVMAGRFGDAFAPSQPNMGQRFTDAFKPDIAHEALVWALFP